MNDAAGSVILVEPSEAHSEAVMDFRREMMREAIDGTGELHGCGRLEQAERFEDWLDFDVTGRRRWGDAYVPEDVYLALREGDGRLVGMITFRHPLTDALYRFCGHVGYSVRPSERGRGYGREMLRLLLAHCREAGERRILVTCARENMASRKVIEANGGTLEDDVPETIGLSSSGVARRYWIELSGRGRNPLLDGIIAARCRRKVPVLSRFFKTGPGEYGAGDRFLGVMVPTVRRVVSSCLSSVTFDDLVECVTSPFHEVRLSALLSLVRLYNRAGGDEGLQARCVSFYLEHASCVNNWDLVDLSCYELLGRWFLTRDRELLYDLASHGRTLWEQRIGIVSTMQFIRHGELSDTFAIAEILLSHPHDLIHKATGWLLREAGKRDKAALEAFLATHGSYMSRTTLRYAIERFPAEERRRWLSCTSR